MYGWYVKYGGYREMAGKWKINGNMFYHHVLQIQKKKGENIINITRGRRIFILILTFFIFCTSRYIIHIYLNSPTYKDTKTHTQTHHTYYNFSQMRLKDKNGRNHIENKEFRWIKNFPKIKPSNVQRRD